MREHLGDETRSIDLSIPTSVNRSFCAEVQKAQKRRGERKLGRNKIIH